MYCQVSGRNWLKTGVSCIEGEGVKVLRGWDGTKQQWYKFLNVNNFRFCWSQRPNFTNKFSSPWQYRLFSHPQAKHRSAYSLLEKGQGTGNCCAVFKITIRELQLENQSKVCPGAGWEGRHPDPHAGIKPVWAARIASARDSVRSCASGLLLRDHFNASRVSTNVSPGIRMRFRKNVYGYPLVSLPHLVYWTPPKPSVGSDLL